jgi:hypothetical protein
MICTLTNYYRAVKSRRIKWAGCVAHVGERRDAYRVLVEKPEENNHLEDTGVDGRMILKWILNMLDGGMDWIHLAQNRGRWQTLVNAVINFRVS